ncbi:uncharacterized protein PHALS_05781 [Plasmopara halstedii]|uniref:Uncharacterized protein n=1 Tax=Plasmopara halstedii TaxID=4781 RepID=A0A0P1AAF7_PLAHL|nr:uncharacterized protein PHALS_05781 [Plasmopara halstedii]CEG37724.1 hypothetical protein PHALS_05781 [Plasmopara halstedii]|eukprot:XP_024574093.1 hypothetical protein PHALS_05781 [Plasmopara halstedii]
MGPLLDPTGLKKQHNVRAVFTLERPAQEQALICGVSSKECLPRLLLILVHPSNGGSVISHRNTGSPSPRRGDSSYNLIGSSSMNSSITFSSGLDLKNPFHAEDEGGSLEAVKSHRGTHRW